MSTSRLIEDLKVAIKNDSEAKEAAEKTMAETIADSQKEIDSKTKDLNEADVFLVKFRAELDLVRFKEKCFAMRVYCFLSMFSIDLFTIDILVATHFELHYLIIDLSENEAFKVGINKTNVRRN